MLLYHKFKLILMLLFFLFAQYLDFKTNRKEKEFVTLYKKAKGMFHYISVSIVALITDKKECIVFKCGPDVQWRCTVAKIFTVSLGKLRSAFCFSQLQMEYSAFILPLRWSKQWFDFGENVTMYNKKLANQFWSSFRMESP